MASMVHLVRHGEVENPKHLVYAFLPGFGLSQLGCSQAEEAARYLSRRPVAQVWSSPLERALRTAEQIASRHQLAVHVDADLTEWGLAEVWMGYPWEEIPERFPGQLEAYATKPWDLPFSPESLRDLTDRVATVARRLHEGCTDGDVVMVAHQDPMQAAGLALTGRPEASFIKDKPAHCTIVSLRPGPSWKEVARWQPPQGEAFPPS